MASNIIREKWFGWGWRSPKGTPYSIEPTQTKATATKATRTKAAPTKSK